MDLKTHLKSYATPLLFMLLMGLLYLYYPNLPNRWVLDTETLPHSPWQLFTAHWIHVNEQHYFLNSASLLAVVTLFPLLRRSLYFLSLLLFGSAGVDLGLLFIGPEFYWYAGFSGVLYAFISAGVVLYWHQQRWKSLLVAFAIIYKIGYEQVYGPFISSVDFIGVEGHIAVQAHLYGAISGLIIGLIQERFSQGEVPSFRDKL